MEDGQSLIIEGSKRKATLVILISIGFVVCGMVLIRDHAFIGWSSILLFGLGILIGMLQLFRKTYLKLDSEGFEVKTVLNAWRLNWTDVDGFYVSNTHGHKMIAIDFSDSYQKMRFGRQIATFLSGIEGAIVNQYVLSPEEICAHLNEWKARI